MIPATYRRPWSDTEAIVVLVLSLALTVISVYDLLLIAVVMKP
jgi:hypothetical protein